MKKLEIFIYNILLLSIHLIYDVFYELVYIYIVIIRNHIVY